MKSKKNLRIGALCATMLFFVNVLSAQCPCGNYGNYLNCSTVSNVVPDYKTPVSGMGFTISSNHIYSQAPNFGITLNDIGGVNGCLGNPTDCDYLGMDIYVPCNLETDRPVVLISGGGGYNSNSRCSKRVQFQAKELVKRGYVVATFSYRPWEGTQEQIDYDIQINNNGNPTKFLAYLNAIPQVDAIEKWEEMVYKTTQDGQNAVRYVKSLHNTLLIDTNKVFMTGHSAGGGVTLHTLYFESSDIPGTWIGYSQFGQWDDFSAGTSDTEELAGGIAQWGFIDSLDYIDQNEPPVALFHGTWDPNVYYQTQSGNGVTAFGSEPVASEAYNKSVPFYLWSLCEGKHGLYGIDNTCISDAVWQPLNDELIDRQTDFYCDVMNQTLSPNVVESNDVTDYNIPYSALSGTCPVMIGGVLTPQLFDWNLNTPDCGYCPTQFSELHTSYKWSPVPANNSEEVLESTSVKVFPNPIADHTLTIETAGGQPEQVSVTDATGRVIPVQWLSSGENQMTSETTLLPAGMYIIEVWTAGEKTTHKLLRQ